MTRLFTDGAEMGDVLFWDYYVAGCVDAVTTPTPVGGEYCYEGAWQGAFKTIGSDLTEFYMRYRLRSDNITQTEAADIIAWRHGSIICGYISLDSLYRFCAYVGSGGSKILAETSGLVMQVDTWYLLELHVLINATVGRIELYVDGTRIINYTGNTLWVESGNPYPHIDNIYWATNAYVSTFLDDLALNDTAGGSDNSWCGDGMIVKMYPDGNGAHNNWTGSDGDGLNNYLLVDEFPHDGDYTYVYCNGASSGTQDQYTLNDLDYTNKTILRIYPEARAKKTAASAYTLKLGILPSGGADDLSTGRTLYANQYSRVVGNEYTTNPVDAGAWEEADLDSLQFIAEVG